MPGQFLTDPSAQELLVFSDTKLIHFLNDSRTDTGGFDISRVTGVDSLSEKEREALSDKLRAATVKAGPLNISQLSRLLDVSQHKRRDSPSQTRSSTSSPSPEDDYRFEAFCYDELTRAGGKPLIPIEALLQVSKEPILENSNIWAWLGDNIPIQGDVLPLFSRQLEDWSSFQHKWQQDNRGKSEEGFSAFLESDTRMLLHKGESRLLSSPYYEETTRRIWNDEIRYLEQSGRRGFAAYKRAVKERLVSHNFLQPFQLAKDPRRQDKKTTWIEYINYNYWWQDKQTAELKATEPQYRNAWDELQHFHARDMKPGIDEDLSIRTELEATKNQIRKFIRDTKPYQLAESAIRRQNVRIKWLIEQLSPVKTASPRKHNDSNTGTSKKRKPANDNEESTRNKIQKLSSSEPRKESVALRRSQRLRTLQSKEDFQRPQQLR